MNNKVEEDLEKMLLYSKYTKCETCNTFYKNLKMHMKSKKHNKNVIIQKEENNKNSVISVVNIDFNNLIVEI
jgi:hypothetical protein